MQNTFINGAIIDMKNYKVFKHPDGRIEAVKQGWSWPGFFFGLIWALIKKLWLVAGVLILIAIVSAIISEVASPDTYNYDSSSTILSGLFSNAITLIVAIVIGMKGNSFRENNLISRGYEFIGNATADNPDMALAEVQKAESSHTTFRI